jgi:hypothetical protein
VFDNLVMWCGTRACSALKAVGANKFYSEECGLGGTSYSFGFIVVLCVAAILVSAIAEGIKTRRTSSDSGTPMT